MELPAGASNVELYQSSDGSVSLEVKTDGDTVWLTQDQIASLFGRERSVISRHIANAEREELAGNPTRAKYAQVQVEGDRRVERMIEHFNLDTIMSVGYRVKSPEGVRFRRWANDVLRRYLISGVATNESRLRDIALITHMLERSADEAVSGIATLLHRYAPGLALLEQYDRDALPEPDGTRPAYQLDYSDARAVVDELAEQFPDDELLGNERGAAFRGAIEAIGQTFMGADLYPSVQAKAAHLLYFVTKDHPFSDGNKRSAAALFTYFLERNGALTSSVGTELVPPNMLTALTLMVANSEPREKETVIRLIRNLIDIDDSAAR